MKIRIVRAEAVATMALAIAMTLLIAACNSSGTGY
jgi:hypothetical protein